MERKNRKLTIYLLMLYLVLLVWVVVFKCAIPREIMGNLFESDPLKFGPVIGEYMELDLYHRFIFDFVRPDKAYEIFNDALLNILVFIPMGLLVALVAKKYKKTMPIITSFILSLSIELFQLFTAFGSFSFIDLLSNVIGGILGMLLYLLLMRIVTQENVNKVIYHTCIISFVIFIPVLIFAIVQTSLNFEYIIYRFSYYF